MALFVTLFSLAVLIADAWTLRRISMSIDTPMDKFLFGLMVIILPVVGIFLWHFAGPSSSFVKKNKYT